MTLFKIIISVCSSRRICAVPLLVVLLAVCACGNGSVRQQIESKADYIDDAKSWADSVMRDMTLEQMVGQLFMPSAYASDDTLNIRRLREYVSDCHVGGILFLQGDVRSLSFAVDILQDASGVPLFMALDAEWGLGMRLNDAPRFPMQGNLSDSIDDQTMYDYGSEMAREARVVGLNMLLGPVVDVLTNPDNKAIGKRSFGADPHRVAELATAYARGMEDGNVISIAKHFPGHGGTNTDSHYALPEVDADIAELDSVELFPFKQYVLQNLSGIMVGHLYMSALDSVHRSASLSKSVIKDLLIGKLGFSGLVITDAVNMGGAVSKEPVGLSALRAGADIVLSPANTSAEIDSVLAAVRSGDFSAEDIEKKCCKVLMYKYRFARAERLRCQNLLQQLNSVQAVRMQQRLSH